jgi:hypothetical protein
MGHVQWAMFNVQCSMGHGVEGGGASLGAVWGWPPGSEHHVVNPPESGPYSLIPWAALLLARPIRSLESRPWNRLG